LPTGFEHRELSGVVALGVDEIHVGRKEKFWTLVYQIDCHCKRLLWVGRDRTEKTFESFFEKFGAEFCAGIGFLCSDMWKPYLNAAARWTPAALRILDRFRGSGCRNLALPGVYEQALPFSQLSPDLLFAELDAHNSGKACCIEIESWTSSFSTSRTTPSAGSPEKPDIVETLCAASCGKARLEASALRHDLQSSILSRITSESDLKFLVFPGCVLAKRSEKWVLAARRVSCAASLMGCAARRPRSLPPVSKLRRANRRRLGSIGIFVFRVGLFFFGRALSRAREIRLEHRTVGC